MSYAAALAGKVGTPAGAAVATSAFLPDCKGQPVIKGNINAKGDKIYHTNDSPVYDKVIIEEKEGERYFCTAAEAEAAGWRGSLRQPKK
jgi:hypothetical protein